MSKDERVPVPALERLSTYIRCLMQLERDGVDKIVKVSLILARRRQDQSWRNGIDGDVRSERQRHHPRHRRKYVLAQDVSDMGPIVPLQARVMQVDDLAAADLMRKRAAEDKRNPGVHLQIRGHAQPAEVR